MGTKPTPTEQPKGFREWAIESGWITGDQMPPLCAICALPDAIRREVEMAWGMLGARESELTAYLASIGIEMPSTEPFAQHFRNPEVRQQPQ